MHPPEEPKKVFTIHVFNHVRKFILMEYKHTNGVIKAEEYSVLGKLVTFAIIDKRAWRSQNDQERNRINATIKIELTKDQLSRGPRGALLQRLNIDMDTLFKNALMQWIKAQGNDGKSHYAACKSFLEYYNLEESDYSLDAAYKYWQRNKDK